MKCRSGGVYRLCLSSRLSSGPPDDPSSCSFEGSSQAVWVSIFFFSAVEIVVLNFFFTSFDVRYIGITLDAEV